jgi:hypothetical protein
MSQMEFSGHQLDDRAAQHAVDGILADAADHHGNLAAGHDLLRRLRTTPFKIMAGGGRAIKAFNSVSVDLWVQRALRGGMIARTHASVMGVVLPMLAMPLMLPTFVMLKTLKTLKTLPILVPLNTAPATCQNAVAIWAQGPCLTSEASLDAPAIGNIIAAKPEHVRRTGFSRLLLAKSHRRRNEASCKQRNRQHTDCRAAS